MQVNLNNPTKGEKSDLPTLAQTAIDLTNIMIPFLSSDTFENLWNLFFPLLRLKEDPNMQRRAYRSLTKLAEAEAGKDFLVDRLDQVTEILKRNDTHTTSQKVRHSHNKLTIGSNSCPSSDCRYYSNSIAPLNSNHPPRGSHRN